MNCLLCKYPLNIRSGFIFISCNSELCLTYDLNYQLDNNQIVDLSFDLSFNNESYTIIQTLSEPFVLNIANGLFINSDKILMPEEVKKKLPIILSFL